MKRKLAKGLAGSLAPFAVAWGQGDPATIAALVERAEIEGVQLGIARAEAASILLTAGYLAEPVAAPGPGRGGTRSAKPCVQGTAVSADRYSTPVAKVDLVPGSPRPSGEGGPLNPYVSTVQISYSCADEKVTRISREAAAYWKETAIAPRASEQRFFADAKERYEALCPAPAESSSAVPEHFRAGTVAQMTEGRIECSRSQARLSAKYQKQEAGQLYDYAMGLQANARNATYTVEISTYPAH